MNVACKCLRVCLKIPRDTAAGLLAWGGVVASVTARYGDAPPAPPCPKPKSLATAPRAIFRHTLTLALAALGTVATHGGGEPVGVVSHIKVLSSRVPDVSSLEAWRGSFISDGLSDKEKALAVWRSVVTFQHQDAPPRELLQAEGDVLDPIKLFNVYGYSYCSVASANSIALARAAGLKARGWSINQHSVCEYSFDDSWHLMDASLINYFPKSDGSFASVEEIVASVKDWYGTHPSLKSNDAGLRKFMTGGGWKNGPQLLGRSAFYDDNGWLPAAAHGWYSTMQEYDGSTLFAYESGYSQGYEVNVQLRHGERLTRNWSNHGLHVNMDQGAAPACLKTAVGQEELRYTPQYGDLANGRIGNGSLEYTVPLASGDFRLGALGVRNLACESEDRQTPAVHVKNAAELGSFVLRMPSSYVYLSGEVSLTATVGSGGAIAILFSDNNGLDWREISSVKESGPQRVDLKPFVFRRYDYRLKFVLRGAGTGLGELKIAHDIQHSQRPLPALAQGANTLSFSSNPPEGTVAVEGSTDLKSKGRQLVFTDFHPATKGLVDGKILLAGGTGEIAFPIETPGEMTRLRIGTSFRARGAKDLWEIQVSYDDGQNFKTVDRLEGPTVAFDKYTVVSDVPAGVKSALVRFAGTQRNTLMISNFRISADYREPLGGFQPVKVTYQWEENGRPKQDMHVARSPAETYQINCASKPTMKSITLELAE